MKYTERPVGAGGSNATAGSGILGEEEGAIVHGHPKPLEDLVRALGRLPGVGPRSAARMAFWALRAPAEAVREIASALLAVRERVRPCATCGALTEDDPCPICADPGRDRSAICVVEEPADVVAFERAGTYRGLYHVLGGAIAPLDGVHPEDLRIESLLRRAQDAVAEVILATDPNVEGEATALYVAERLREAAPRVRVSRLAHGLPVGGDLEYADALTLGKALEGRRPLG